jgi:hypothetical protein
VRVTKHLCNLLQDRLNILHHLIVPKAKHSIALVHEECCPSSICFHLRGMLSTIQFYNQSALRAAEVSDEGTDGMLSSELCAV